MSAMGDAEGGYNKGAHTVATSPVLSAVVSIVTGSSLDAVVYFRINVFVPAV